MQIDRARSDHAAARQRDLGVALAAQERSENADGAAHLADQIVIAHRLQFPGMDLDRVGVHLDLRSQRAENLGHEFDIAQIRHAPDNAWLGSEQRRGHNWKHGILRAADRHIAAQRHTAAD